MIEKFKQHLIVTFVADLFIHLLIFRRMAHHINTHGFGNLQWWNRWAYEFFFANHGHPAIALDPAIQLCGDNLFTALTTPFLLIFSISLFGNKILQLTNQIVQLLIRIAKPLIIAMFQWLEGIYQVLVSLVQEKMEWFISLFGWGKKKDTSKGSSEFATKREMRKFLNRKYSGLLIDGEKRIKQSLSVRHVTVIAPSGQGKTTNYVIPNVLGLPDYKNPDTDMPASMVITDPKGEIYDLTSQYLANKGYNIKVIEVDKPFQSEHFNPLQRANSDKELAKVAQIIVESGNTDAKSNDFWANSAKMQLTTILKIIKRSSVSAESQNLHNVKRFVDLMGGDGRPMLDFVAHHCTDATAITEYTSFVQQDSETISNILMTLKSVLKDLAVDEICQLTKDDTVDIEALRKEKTVLYIITPFSDIEYYRFILTILYTQIFSYCDKVKDGNDIVFMLDEFGNLGKIPNFTQLITTLRSSGCSVSMILQDMEQLRMVYGQSGASTIFNGGCSSKVFFGGIQNIKTLEEISKILGTKTLEQKTSEGKELPSISRRIMLPEEISKMPIGSGLFVSSGQNPVKLQMKQYKDTSLKNRIQRNVNGHIVSVPKPNVQNQIVNYFEFDKYIDSMVDNE